MNLLYIFTFFIITTIHAKQPVDLTLIESKQDTYAWHIKLDLDAKDAFYADYFDVSADHPTIKINSWKILQPSQEIYDTTFKQTKKIIDKPVTIQIDTTIEKFPDNAHFHVTYHRRNHHTIQHELLSIKNPLPPHPKAQEINHTNQYSPLKKKSDFYTPSPIAIMLALIITLMAAYYYLKRSRNLYGIVLIAFSVFLGFQLMKSMVLYRKIKHNLKYTLLSQRKPPQEI